MARSKPQTEFHVSYGAVTLNSNADALLPVLIAPRYEVHNAVYGNAEFGSGAIYSGAIMTSAWPFATSGAEIDRATAQPYIVDPVVKLTLGTPKSVETGGIMVFSGGVVGSGSIVQKHYSLRPGDQLSAGGSVYNVLSIGPIISGATTKLVSGGAVVTSGGNWTATYNGDQSAVYVLTPTAAAASGAVTFNAIAAIGDPGYQSTVKLTTGGAVAIGNHGATLAAASLAAGAIGADDVLVLSCTPGTEGAYARVQVDVNGTPASGATVVQTSNFVTGTAPIGKNFWSSTDSNVTISANAECVYKGNSYPIVSGGVEVNYRERLTEDTNVLLTGSEASSWVGAQVPENPLGEMYKAAVQTGYNDFFVIAPDGDTDEAYEAALEVAGRTERAYSIVELRQTPETIAAGIGVVANYSKPTVAQMKRFWVYSQIKQEAEVLSTTAEASDSTVTFGSATETVNIVRGDIITFPSVYEANGYVSKSGVVKSVSGATVTLESSIGDIADTLVVVTRKLNHTQLAEAIAADARRYDNSRINYVYAEPNTVAGDAFEDARFIIPVLATMRATMAPHAPLTDVPIPGVSIGNGVGFTESDLDLMNDAGVWICYRDGRGEMVTRHAITTGGDGTIAEEDSAVSNGDNIIRTVRNQVSWLRGNCNVTPALIDKIYVTVQAAFTSIKSRNYDALIGPQILEVISVDVQQDPNNTAGVIGKFDLDLPDVYLDGDFTFNLL